MEIPNGKTTWVNGIKVTGLAGSNTDLYAQSADGASLKIANTSPYSLLIPNSSTYAGKVTNVAAAIGLTAAKIVKGNTILGIIGTGSSEEKM